ncbi:MAG: twin-arginine translocase TatA/TatE family subunit [Kiritimatiellae bacterium]|nr:twin-arginine translocase TatA/TatE family subunit [Kiritimatiellia bacterium]
MAWGPWQILLVIVVIVLVFGSKKLPELARALGKAKGEFKRGTAEGEALLKEEEEKAKSIEQKKEAENA